MVARDVIGELMMHIIEQYGSSISAANIDDN
jgi:hypothetical protein